MQPYRAKSTNLRWFVSNLRGEDSQMPRIGCFVAQHPPFPRRSNCAIGARNLFPTKYRVP